METTISSFCTNQKSWLNQEFEHDSSAPIKPSKDTKDQQDEGRRTRVLRKLSTIEVSVGLYGRTVVQFREDDDQLLPAHKFTTGDEVEIRNKAEQRKNPSGVVCEVTDVSISVALFPSRDDTEVHEFLESPPFSLIPVSNVQVHKKMVAALSELETKGVDHKVCGDIVRCLFQPASQDDSVIANVDFKPYNSNLDESQVEAISFALSAQRPVTLIHGPPGTGKTTTVAELIRQAVRNSGMKVLVAAPSNVAVDNLLARLASAEKPANKSKSQKGPLRMVRLGHPARLQPEILRYSLEALVKGSAGTEIVEDVRKELQSYLKVLANPRGRDKRVAYKEMKILRKEIRVREEKVVDELIRNAQVVMATCVGAANNRILRDIEFDIVVIDEAAQALEAACWIPILRGKKLVMAGDHLQLPPTIQCDAIQKELGQTLFERVMALYKEESGKDGKVSRMLKVQYRMNEKIANWASTKMYGGELLTHDTIKTQTLSELEAVTEELEDSLEPLVLIDTAGCAMYETANSAGSRYNEGEAQLVEKHVLKLIEIGVRPEQIAVITPYNGQVEILKRDLLPQSPKLQIRSVDGFQGGEREAVVLSLVRSNERRGNIGFLRDERRLNVAVTRAKRHCCIICDSETVSHSSFIQSLVDWVQDYGTHLSALEMAEGINVDLSHVESAVAKLSETRVFKTKEEKLRDEERRRQLKAEIEAFVERASPGESFIMDDKLSKFERFLVHEIAEELGIEHLSEGREGIDRKIRLRVPLGDHEEKREEVGNGSLMKDVQKQPTPAPTSALDAKLDGNIPRKSQSSCEAGTIDENLDIAEASTPQTTTTEEKEIESGFHLGKLAKEREERKQARKVPPQPPANGSKPKVDKSKKRGKKLGGTKKAPEKFDTMDDLDDMAFLDAQIDKVQNSHGVKFEGSGKTYRTVVNGILLSKPKKVEAKRNERASAALKTKLKKAQVDRKAKDKPK